MIKRLELPKLLFVNQHGKEFYLDPMTNRAKPMEIAFAGFEALKFQDEKRMYLKVLSKKKEDNERCQVTTTRDAQGVTITGKLKHKPRQKPEKKDPESTFLKFKKLYEQVPLEELPKKQNSPTALAYYLMNYAFFYMNSKRKFDQENDQDFDLDSRPTLKNRRKRLKILA